MYFAVYLLIFLLSFFSCEAKHHKSKKEKFQYELSACAMFQNEAPFLKEWIEYHRLLGVEHFYLYNNSSTDDFHAVLDPYINTKIVELKDWPSPTNQDWTPHQHAAIWDAIITSKDKTKWLAMIDIDEFIVPHYTESLIQFLKPYDKMSGIAGVIINWQMFGTSGVWEIPDNMLMIECLTHKAIKTWDHNQNHKSIVKPKYCNGHWIHYGNFIPGWAHRQSLDCGQWPHIDEIQVNHYWLRNEKWMREVKAPRRARYEGAEWNEAVILSYIEQTSTDVDLSIQRFVPALKKRMAFSSF